jgi:hypothetical protein
MHCRVAYLLLVCFAFGCSEKRPRPTVLEPRLARLERQAAEQREATDAAVRSYAPRAKDRLDDLTAPAADLLRQLPGVAEVEVLVGAPRPARRKVRSLSKDEIAAREAQQHAAAGA